MDKQISKRHHYIPEYYIDGFTDNNGFLCIYDKQKNKIIRNLRPPKSIFFEENLNSISVGANLSD